MFYAYNCEHWETIERILKCPNFSPAAGMKSSFDDNSSRSSCRLRKSAAHMFVEHNAFPLKPKYKTNGTNADQRICHARIPHTVFVLHYVNFNRMPILNHHSLTVCMCVFVCCHYEISIISNFIIIDAKIIISFEYIFIILALALCNPDVFLHL